jgi:mono/diheme cytochrome c family protein
LILVAIAGLAGCAGDESPGDPEATGLAAETTPLAPALVQAAPPGTSEAELREGQELYVVCSVCHGSDARGTQLGPSLRDTSWIHIPGEIDAIATIIRNGVQTPSEFPIPMPVMGGGSFDDRQLRAIATYLYTLGRIGL